MRIGVVSDTHLPRFGRTLPPPLVAALREADVHLILHLGDWTDALAIPLLEAVAPVDGVAGNNDGADLVARLGRRKIVELDGARMGLTHGDLGIGPSTPERAVRTFEADDVSAVLFGHSHIPLLERLPGGRVVLNPGSPTDKRRQRRYSWALLEIADGAIEAELRFFDR
ncbi:MAG: metallophosphoesterase family protein [Chloroflexota bacterium]|jgi:putative phosphoesterase